MKNKKIITVCIVLALFLLGWITYRFSYHYSLLSVSIGNDIKHKEGGLVLFPRIYILNPFKVKNISEEIAKYAHLIQAGKQELTKINGILVINRVRFVMKKIAKNGFVFKSMFEKKNKAHIYVRPRNLHFGVVVVIDMNTDNVIGFY